MADKLKQLYNIVVLKCEVTDARVSVQFTLQAKLDGALTDLHTWSSTLGELGLQYDCRSGIDARLPQTLVADVNLWMRQNAADTQPLWIHLVKPYGALRLMPWERAFGLDFPHAILMLPDFIFPPPRESAATLDIALCASAPLDTEEHWLRNALVPAIARILEAQVRSTRVHVFTDAVLQPVVRDAFTVAGTLDSRIIVYDGEFAAPYAATDPTSRLMDSAGQLRSPWLLWMRAALKQQSIDVAHFVGHGYLTRDRGALLLAQSPLERTDEYLAGPVGSIELSTFLTQIGAWGTVFTAVLQNNSEPGLRALADEIAQCRPGPLLMHVVQHDREQIMLPAAYRVLFDTTPASMPRSPSLFLYCQPYRVQGSEPGQYEVGASTRSRGHLRMDSPVARSAHQSRVAEAVNALPSALDRVFDGGAPVKSWVAATERVAEQAQLRIQTSSRDDADDEWTQNFRDVATMSVLDSLRESVAEYAAEDVGRESPGGAA